MNSSISDGQDCPPESPSPTLSNQNQARVGLNYVQNMETTLCISAGQSSGLLAAMENADSVTWPDPIRQASYDQAKVDWKLWKEKLPRFHAQLANYLHIVQAEQHQWRHSSPAVCHHQRGFLHIFDVNCICCTVNVDRHNSESDLKDYWDSLAAWSWAKFRFSNQGKFGNGQPSNLKYHDGLSTEARRYTMRSLISTWIGGCTIKT